MYQGGASSATTLLDLGDATSITMSGGHDVNILAPNAAVHYTSGTVTGNLIVGALTGSGSVAWGGGFQGASAVVVPAPSGAAAVALGAGGVLMIRRRRGR
jgi:choice-of-anchor A domain-containing protein